MERSTTRSSEFLPRPEAHQARLPESGRDGPPGGMRESRAIPVAP